MGHIIPAFRQFESPRPVGTVEPEVFQALQEVCGGEDTGTEWYRSGREQYRPDVFEALVPLHRYLLEHHARRFGMAPHAIFYTVDTTTVVRGESQRGTHWHIDSGTSGGAFVTADALPTQFLTADKISQGKARRRYVENWWNPLTTEPWLKEMPRDEELPDVGLSIVNTEPFCLTAMRNHVHRSMPNETGQEVPRTWIRASIVRYERQLSSRSK